MNYINYLAECNCKNLSYNFYTKIPISEWLLRTCGCSFCKLYSSHIYCSDNSGFVNFYFKNISDLKIVKHGTETADFLICNKCSNYIGAVMKSEIGIFAVLNIEHLNKKVKITNPYKLKWNNENKAVRLTRRHETWTPVKKYMEGI
tara:strand:- start:146 stop:583 length:438 start_codon:yes stop_codon:yes gene_type:complete